MIHPLKNKLGLPEEVGKVITLEDWEWEKIRIEVSKDVDIESYRPTVALEIRDGLRVGLELGLTESQNQNPGAFG